MSPVRSLLAPALVGVFVVGFAVGCSQKGTDDFSDGVKEEFLTACTDPFGDSRLVGEVCECSYQKISESTSYGEVQEWDRRLKDDVLLKVPVEAQRAVAECLGEKAKLD